MNNFFFGANHITTADGDLKNECNESNIGFKTFFDSSNFKRDYSKGKSFKFSIWNATDTYNNDDFIQDFVQHNRKLWAYISDVPTSNIEPSENSAVWQLVLEGVSDCVFREINGELQYKYEEEDDNSWKSIFTIERITEEEIKDMFDELYLNPYDDELSETSDNAVQNKVITAKFKTKQDVISDLEEIRRNSKFALQNIPSEYITESELETRINEIPKPDLSEYCTKEEVTSNYVKISELDTISEAELNNLFK